MPAGTFLAQHDLITIGTHAQMKKSEAGALSMITDGIVHISKQTNAACLIQSFFHAIVKKKKLAQWRQHRHSAAEVIAAVVVGAVVV